MSHESFSPNGHFEPEDASGLDDILGLEDEFDFEDEFRLAETQARYSSGRIERFEDFEAWKKARLLTRAVYWVTQRTPAAKDYGFKDQIQRAAVSTMSNIAEGFERGRPTEFHQYLSMAKGSAAEVRSLIYVALDAHYINEEQFGKLITMSTNVSNLLGALRVSVQRRRDTK